MPFFNSRNVTIAALFFTNLTAFIGADFYENDDVECCSNGWFPGSLHNYEIETRALFLKPTGSSLSYAAEAKPLPRQSPSWKIHDVETNYHTGFEVGGACRFHQRSTNIKLNWQHLHATDTSRRNVPSNSMIGPFFEIGPDALPYTKAKGKARFQFDSICLDGGINFCYGDYLRSNFYLGVNGTRINQTLKSTYSNYDKSIKRSISSPSTFVGAGPQFGFDLTYGLVGNFNLTGSASASLLVGSQKNHTQFESTSPALNVLKAPKTNIQLTNVHHRTQVVPAFEGRLGMSYSFDLFNFDFDLEAGYDAKVYINAIQTTNIGSEVSAPPVSPDSVGVFARTFQRNTCNFALSGPYISLKVNF